MRVENIFEKCAEAFKLVRQKKRLKQLEHEHKQRENKDNKKQIKEFYKSIKNSMKRFQNIQQVPETLKGTLLAINKMYSPDRKNTTQRRPQNNYNRHNNKYSTAANCFSQ